MLEVISSVLCLDVPLIIQASDKSRFGITLDSDDSIDGFVFPVGEIAILMNLNPSFLFLILERTSMKLQEI